MSTIRMNQIKQLRAAGHTYAAIGICFGISRQRVEQIVKGRKFHKRKVLPFQHICKRCEYVWNSRLENPKVCPGCHTRRWAREAKRGRKKQAG